MRNFNFHRENKERLNNTKKKLDDLYCLKLYYFKFKKLEELLHKTLSCKPLLAFQ